MWIEILFFLHNYTDSIVTSHTEVWIEIYITLGFKFFTEKSIVTSHTEVWIEIYILHFGYYAPPGSPPIRRCGLKFIFNIN